MKRSNIMKTFLPGMILLFIAGCQDNFEVTPDQQLKTVPETLSSYGQELSYTIYKQNSYARSDRRGRGEGLQKAGEVIKRPTFFTLLTALEKTKLLPVVAQNELTLFAPTDDAFEAIGLNPSNIGGVPNLKGILLYHVVGGKVFASDLSNGYVPSLNDASIRVSIDEGIFINDAEVIKADIQALNGVIHVIDQVLLPPTLVDIVTGNENFSILEEALVTAGLVDVLDDAAATYTVFAPTNDAFASLLQELDVDKATLLGLPNLDEVLLYHVLVGEVLSSDLSDGLTAEMANGEDITFDLSGAPTIFDVNGREVPLNTGLLDIKATNGVVHVIDRVLLPTL